LTRLSKEVTKKTVQKPVAKTSRDEEHYMQYTKDGARDDSGYSLTGSFAEHARKAIFDLSASVADDPTLRKSRESDSRKKLLTTEFGTKVPASFRSDAYDKWRAKTHLDIQQPGEIESEASSSRAKSILTGNDERRRWRNKRLTRK
jgi:ATP-dependent RNA helicase DDX54/DBP10